MNQSVQANAISKNFNDYNYNGDTHVDFIEAIASLNGVTKEEFKTKIVGKNSNGKGLTYQDILDLGINVKGNSQRRAAYIEALKSVKFNDRLVDRYIAFTNQLNGKKYLMETAQAKVREKSITRGIGLEKEEITPYNVFNPVITSRLADEKLGGFKIILTAKSLNKVDKAILDTDKRDGVSMDELLASYKPGPNTYLIVRQKEGETDGAYQKRLALAKQKEDKANYFLVMSPDEFYGNSLDSLTSAVDINNSDYELYTAASHAGHWTISEAEWESYGPK